MRRSASGMTLLEVLLAVSITAVVVLLLVGGLRIGLRAWEAGERQAAAQQERRAIVELVTEALAAAYPYRASAGGGLQRVVLFQGEPEEVRFVTTVPPLALDAPAAPFHAVTLGRTEPDRLRVVERLVPNEAPFSEGLETTLSRAVTTFHLQYRDEAGAWLDRWDGQTAAGLPTAVRVELAVRTGRKDGAGPPVTSLVVPIALGKEAPG